MATVQTTVINRALRLIEQLPSGKSPSTDETADALLALNALLDRLRNKKLMAFAFQEESLTLSNGTASYTIGASGTLTTTRPVAIEQAWILDNSESFEVRPMTEEQYALIPLKTLSGDWPTRRLFRGSNTNVTVIVWPVPNATRTMKLVTRVPLTVIAAASETLTFPPGWEDLLANGLAIAIAPEYGTRASPDVRGAYAAAMDGIQGVNSRPILCDTGLSDLVGHQRSPDIRLLDA